MYSKTTYHHVNNSCNIRDCRELSEFVCSSDAHFQNFIMGAILSPKIENIFG